MSTAAELELPPQANIVALVEANPVMVLTDRQKFNAFYEAIKRETDALEVDLTTEKGRKAIASMAYRVAQTKTAIDAAGKLLNEEARARINVIDASRREIKQQLDELRDEVRRPLTEWEEAEDARVIRCQDVLAHLRQAASVGYEETAAEVRVRLDGVKALEFDEVEFNGYGPQAMSLREQAVDALAAAVARLDREEAERAELEKLRAEAAEREAEAARVAAAQEAARKEAEELRLYNERRAAAEKAEAERIEAAREEAAAAAQREAEKVAAAERERIEREHEEALAAERRRTEEVERAAQAERDRLAAQETARKAAAEKEAAAQAKREANQRHRSAVMRAAKEAVMKAGPVDEDTAKAIVLAIAAGNIPAVAISF